jgi:hypothetical protein
VEEGVGDAVVVFDLGFGMGEDETRKDLEVGAAEEDIVDLIEELDTFKLVARVGVGVAVAEAVGTLVVSPGGVSKIASTQCDFPPFKPEHLGLIVGFCVY